MPRLSQISIYPVKSCAGSDLQKAQLDRFGLVGDRRWMLVDGAGGFVSQREFPQLALMAVELNAAGITLVWGGERMNIASPAAGKPRLVQVWGDSVAALDAGDAVATWLGERLEQPWRLVYMPEDSQRLVDGEYASQGETVSFADGFPLLLVSQAALDNLNARLQKPVPMNRFRPNLVVTGCEPHAEDSWQQIRIGDMEFDVAKPCARCAVPSIDQDSGLKDSEILRVLAAYRRREDPQDGSRQVYFGQNLLYRGSGQLTLGDEVTILR
ncbi:MAG: MOSC N-terminal beta barrel domain-containing protein [Halieaceae bacterium]